MREREKNENKFQPGLVDMGWPVSGLEETTTPTGEWNTPGQGGGKAAAAGVTRGRARGSEPAAGKPACNVNTVRRFSTFPVSIRRLQRCFLQRVYRQKYARDEMRENGEGVR